MFAEPLFSGFALAVSSSWCISSENVVARVAKSAANPPNKPLQLRRDIFLEKECLFFFTHRMIQVKSLWIESNISD